jgi:hypothetical protein
MQFGGLFLMARGAADATSAASLQTSRGSAVVTGAEIDLHQRVLVAIGPVDDLLRHQILVRDQEFAAVAGGDGNIAGLHRADAPRAVADGDEIARLHRFIRQQDDAADEIGDDLLQAEADADAGRARKDRQRREIDADRAHGGRDGEYHQRQSGSS